MRLPSFLARLGRSLAAPSAPSGAATIEIRPRHVRDRPDIVLFLTDEQRHDEVGYAGGGHYETPALDALAARGTIFERAYSSSTVCVPARASLLTGLSHHRLPLESNTLALREGFWTIARALRAVGYETVLVGKMHFFPMYADHGFDTMRLAEHLVPFSGYETGEIDDYHRFLIWQGRADARATHMFAGSHEEASREFERNFGAVAFPYDKELHSVAWIAEEARRAVARRRPGAPLFLVVSFPRPHSPYDPPEPYASMYGGKPQPAVSSYAVNEGLPDEVKSAFDRSDRTRHRPQRVSDLPDGVLERVLTHVRGMVRFIDDSMDRVIQTLDPTRTVFFFTSDHGTYGGHRGLLGKVPWIGFEDLARVPLVCVAPGGVPGQKVQAPVQSHDFVPTVLDYAGFDIPSLVFDSTSLKAVVEGGRAPEDRSVFSGISMGWPMARKRNLKLIRRGRLFGPEMLFDLERDPGETTSVIAEPRYEAGLSELRLDLALLLAAPSPSLVTPGVSA